jgi:hypothetical protein
VYIVTTFGSYIFRVDVKSFKQTDLQYRVFLKRCSSLGRLTIKKGLLHLISVSKHIAPAAADSPNATELRDAKYSDVCMQLKLIVFLERPCISHV